MSKSPWRLCAIGLALTAAVTVCAKTQGLTSAWRQVEVTVDGTDAEWQGGAALLVDAPLAVGVVNDAEYMYVRVRTSDRGAILQLLFGGLTVWFDATGTDKKTLGIRYPVGAKRAEAGGGGRGEGRPGGPDAGMPPPPERSGQGGGDRERTGGRGGPPLMDPAEVVPARLELLGAKKDDVRSFTLDDVPGGIRAAIARVENTLVLELRIPLSRGETNRDGIGVTPGATVGLGFETGRIERPGMSGHPGGMGGGPGGGMGGPGGGGGGMGGPPGGMGGMGGGRGGPGGGPGDETSKALKAWAQVRLATAQ